MPTLNRIGKAAVVKHHHEVPFHLLKDVPELGSIRFNRFGHVIILDIVESK